MSNERVVNKSRPSTFYTICNIFQAAKSTRQLLAACALFTIDMLAIITSMLTAFYLRCTIFQNLFPNLYPEKLLDSTFSHIWWFPLVLLLSMIYEKLYLKRLPFWSELEILLKLITLSIFLTIVWLYLAQVNEEISRTLIVLLWLSLIIILPLFRYYGKIVLIKCNLWNRPVILVGSGDAITRITKAFTREKTMGYEVQEIINPHNNKQKSSQSRSAQKFSIAEIQKKVQTIIDSTGVQDIVVALPGLSTTKLIKLTNHFQQLSSNVLLVPDLFGLALSGIELEYFFEEQAILLKIKNRLRSTYNRLLKQFFDLILGFLLFLIFLPLLALLGLAIKLDSKGPVFYVAKRIGQNGEIFNCYKFRTMYINSKELLSEYLANNQEARYEWQRFHKLTHYDPRVTRIGSFLRRFSLDELPQLINIVKGDMSLVGPRPYLISEQETMGEWLKDIQVAKPGLTGLWQVSGRNKISFEGRLKLDSWYMKNWSPWLDFILLFRTIKVVITADGAH